MLVLTNQQQKFTIHFEDWTFCSTEMSDGAFKLPRNIVNLSQNWFPNPPLPCFWKWLLNTQIGAYNSSLPQLCWFLTVHRFLTIMAGFMGEWITVALSHIYGGPILGLRHVIILKWLIILNKVPYIFILHRAPQIMLEAFFTCPRQNLFFPPLCS